MADKPFNIALIGAGDVAQVLHLPVLINLQNLFKPAVICDVSPSLVEHVAKKFQIPRATTDVQSIFSDPNVDIVFNLTTDAFHAKYTIEALQAGKLVFLEKPFTLSSASAKAIIEAEKAAGGNKVFVGYMRRYAKSFTQAFKREVATIPRILYARCRDFVGPNDYFINQSTCFSMRAGDDISAEAKTEAKTLLDGLLTEAVGDITSENSQRLIDYCRYLNTYGSHDISLMRETLGVPSSVPAVSLNHPFYSAMFTFDKQPGGAEGPGFTCTYETGVDRVPVFDAHLSIYGEHKRVEIHYDSPFVKGLAIKVKVDEFNEHGEPQTREFISSYEDAFTIELQEMYKCFRHGAPIKTSTQDAAQDLLIYDMMYATEKAMRLNK